MWRYHGKCIVDTSTTNARCKIKYTPFLNTIIYEEDRNIIVLTENIHFAISNKIKRLATGSIRFETSQLNS